MLFPGIVFRFWIAVQDHISEARLARTLHQTEVFMAKALRGEAVVHLPRASNNAGRKIPPPGGAMEASVWPGGWNLFRVFSESRRW